jgi:hypothetical protein
MKRLTWQAIRSFDPGALLLREEIRFLCPLCGQGEPRDAAHRSLVVETVSGFASCRRCFAAGYIPEAHEGRPDLSAEDRIQLAREFGREMKTLRRTQAEEKRLNTRYARPPTRRRK